MQHRAHHLGTGGEAAHRYVVRGEINKAAASSTAGNDRRGKVGPLGSDVHSTGRDGNRDRLDEFKRTQRIRYAEQGAGINVRNIANLKLRCNR